MSCNNAFTILYFKTVRPASKNLLCYYFQISLAVLSVPHILIVIIPGNIIAIVYKAEMLYTKNKLTDYAVHEPFNQESA